MRLETARVHGHLGLGAIGVVETIGHSGIHRKPIGLTTDGEIVGHMDTQGIRLSLRVETLRIEISDLVPPLSIFLVVKRFEFLLVRF